MISLSKQSRQSSPLVGIHLVKFWNYSSTLMKLKELLSVKFSFFLNLKWTNHIKREFEFTIFTKLFIFKRERNNEKVRLSEILSRNQQINKKREKKQNENKMKKSKRNEIDIDNF